MEGKIINYKEFEILHRHVFHTVFFSAWKGQRCIWGRQIRKDNRVIDWDDPLTKDEKEFLIEGRLV